MSRCRLLQDAPARACGAQGGARRAVRQGARRGVLRFRGGRGFAIAAPAFQGGGDGERRGGGRPVGRRGQGQDRRLAVRAGGRDLPLPGRTQCRPHAGHRRRGLQAEPAALGHRALGQAERDRQRRGARPMGADRRDRAAAGAGGRGLAADADDRREHAADPAGAPRPGPDARGGGGRRQDRHDRARHRPGLRGQGGPAHGAAGRPGRRRDARICGSTGCWPITGRSGRVWAPSRWTGPT